MIRYLRIRNLAVIEHATVELEPGFNVFTGETGAGKSVLVGALSLLLGARASADLVRAGTDGAVVEALVEDADGRELIVRREVTGQGRSRAFLDGELVTAAALKSHLGELIELHGQHEHQRLLDASEHRRLLDQWAGCEPLSASVAAAHSAVVTARGALASFDAEVASRRSRAELIAFQLAELDRISPAAGEEEDLRVVRERLRHADRIARLSREIYADVYEDADSVLARLSRVTKKVAELAEFDPNFRPYQEQGEALKVQVDDLAAAARRLASADADERSLAEVEDRLAALERARKRFGQGSESAHDAWQRLQSEQRTVADSAAERAELETALDAATLRFETLVSSLSTERRNAAPAFASTVGAELSGLAMANASLDVEVVGLPSAAWSASGGERVEFRFSANPGEPAASLERVVSGGELSRLMLAIRVSAGAAGSASTVTFDEVDAGVGGRAALQLGQRLRRLGTSAQVLCVTHLPQVAAAGNAHFAIKKRVSDGRTFTSVSRVVGAARADELARMLAGTLSAQTRAAARDLLDSFASPEAKAKGEQRSKAKGERAGRTR